MNLHRLLTLQLFEHSRHE